MWGCVGCGEQGESLVEIAGSGAVCATRRLLTFSFIEQTLSGGSSTSPMGRREHGSTGNCLWIDDIAAAWGPYVEPLHPVDGVG